MVDSSSTSSSEQLRRLGRRILVFALLACGLDYGLGTLVGMLHGRTVEGDFGGRINLALKQRSDIVVFGSSRAKHHYIPEIIQRETGRTVFNVGFDAQTLLCHFGVQQLVLERHQPEMVILDLNTEDLRQTGLRDPYDKLAVLLPFHDNRRVYELLLTRSKYERIKLWSRLYPYNSQILAILKYNLRPTSEGSSLSGGYVPYHGSDIPQIVAAMERTAGDRPTSFDEAARIDPFYRQILLEFINSARERGVEVVVCRSPLWKKDYYDYASQPQVLEAYRQILRQQQVPLIEIDQATDAAFEDLGLFKDRIHLNHGGAQIFSRILGERLQAHFDQASGLVPVPSP